VRVCVHVRVRVSSTVTIQQPSSTVTIKQTGSTRSAFIYRHNAAGQMSMRYPANRVLP